ncbi:MAG: hypothetical protein EOP08_04645 [Proteobacteria bacterium]|nr:MAG: hypothetical protein EOP08_04645 [Pseudomonadota bacterium]
MWTLVSSSILGGRSKLPLLAGTASVAVLAAVMGAGCGSRDGDAPADVGDPNPLGTTKTLQQLQDPESADKIVLEPAPTCAQAFSTPLTVQGVSVNWVDRYDETGAGAVGTVWIQDYKSQAPFAGSSIFSPSFVPSSLYVSTGDVVDLRGLYQVNLCVGKATFPDGSRLSQVATPVTTFRFEGAPSIPVEAPISDFADFETGRKWIGMLVTFRDVYVDDEVRLDNAGRASVPFSSAQASGGITLSNEFHPLQGVTRGARFASVTGVVTWFFDFKLATRMPEDLLPVPQ